jgi:hypothetical protein
MRLMAQAIPTRNLSSVDSASETVEILSRVIPPRLLEGSTEHGELLGVLVSAWVEVTYYQAGAFGSSERIGEHFVRDTLEGFVEFLVAATLKAPSIS